MGKLENPKSEARNPKWFDELTTLSHVEGQYPMIQIQMTKTLSQWFSVWKIGAFVFSICFEFRASNFEFNEVL
jgi:hypothetical protein